MHCKSYSHFFSKKFQHICVSLDVNFNESLTNDIVSFEQMGPELSLSANRMIEYCRTHRPTVEAKIRLHCSTSWSGPFIVRIWHKSPFHWSHFISFLMSGLTLDAFDNHQILAEVMSLASAAAVCKIPLELSWLQNLAGLKGNLPYAVSQQRMPGPTSRPSALSVPAFAIRKHALVILIMMMSVRRLAWVYDVFICTYLSFLELRTILSTEK